MIIHQNLKVAEEMGVDRAWAINRRRQFLTESVMATDEELSELADFVEAFEVSNELEFFILSDMAEKAIGKKLEIVKELDLIKQMTMNPKETLTDDMIERARAYPVERLIEFRNKKAQAWCHEDRRPSLCHMNKTNRAWCPVCDKYFDPIGVLMERDSLRFIDAVKQLN